MKNSKDSNSSYLVKIGAPLVAGALGTASTVGLIEYQNMGFVPASILGKLLEELAEDFLQRQLSQKEAQRVNKGLYLIKIRSTKNLEKGKQLRQDWLFASNSDQHPDSLEMLEGTLMTFQRQYQDQKLPWIANISANILYDETISSEQYAVLLNIADSLTYRQICFLAFAGLPCNERLGQRAATILASTTNIGIQSPDPTFVEELRTMVYLVRSITTSDLPALTPLGEILYKMMNLDET